MPGAAGDQVEAGGQAILAGGNEAQAVGVECIALRQAKLVQEKVGLACFAL
ncbi:MAG: hypothetical protein ACE5H9_20180 [Anaerolineae bacterium]